MVDSIRLGLRHQGKQTNEQACQTTQMDICGDGLACHLYCRVSVGADRLREGRDRSGMRLSGLGLYCHLAESHEFRDRPA
jgi:hypothetical protein